nr:hypothetical protein GCM10020092_020630 [Actinoplanes digitatis]
MRTVTSDPTTAPVPPDAGPGDSGPGDADTPAAAAPEPAPAPRAAPRPAEAGEWRGIVLVTGTDTDVGKTIVTAAIAAAAQAAGLHVAVVKPGQTGTAEGGPTDIDLVTRLANPHTARTLASYPEPLAPLAAAKVADLPPIELYEVVDAIRAEAGKHDLVLVEGAGGLLVPMGVRPSGEAWTVADLATTLGVPTIVVARAGLGTLNHTALTLEALDRRGVLSQGDPRRLAGRAGAGPLGQPDRAAPPPGRRPSGRRRRHGAGRLPALRARLADPGPLRRPRRLAGLGRRGQLTSFARPCQPAAARPRTNVASVCGS